MNENVFIQKQEVADSTAAKKSTEVQIRELLNKLGITYELRGCEYLTYIIKLGLEDIDNITPITKKCYPHVAEIFGTTSMSVEWAIRVAIKHAAICGDIDTWNYIFEKSYSAKGRPTNKQFIVTLIEYVSSCTKSAVDEETIARTIRKLGVSAKINGYKYLVEIIKLGVDNIDNITSIVKGYSHVAKEYNTTELNVKRCVMSAVEQANNSVELVDPAIWEQVFKNRSSKKRLKQKEFIVSLVNFFLK